MPEIQKLTATTPDLLQHLHSIQNLARQVFEPELPEADYNTVPTSPHLQLDNWRTRLAHKDASIFYISSDQNDPSQALAFFLTHPRRLPPPSDPDFTSIPATSSSYHVYLAAVSPSAQGRDLFQALLHATKCFARETRYEFLTISTVPSRFTRMYSILSQEDSGWEVLGWKESDDGQKMVVMRMDLMVRSRGAEDFEGPGVVS